MPRTKRQQPAAPEVCPVCGEDVPRGALACPECGADHRSGWREDAAVYDGVDAGEDDFDYDRFVAEEFGSSPKPAGTKTIWWVTAVVLLLALVLLYTATLLPFALWVLRSYINGISLDLEHAAMVDGATRFQAFRHVVVPQAVPGVISTGVFTFNAAWSEYLFASTLMTSPDKRTLSPGLTLLFDQTGVYSWAILMAACVLIVVPVIVLFTIVQRQLVSGLGEGALKE